MKTKILNLIKSQDARNLELAFELIKSQNLEASFKDYEILFEWLMQLSDFYHEASYDFLNIWSKKEKTIVDKIHLIATLDDFYLTHGSFSVAEVTFPEKFNYFTSLKRVLIANATLKFAPNFKWSKELKSIQLYDITNTFPKEALKCSSLEELTIGFLHFISLDIDFYKFPDLKELNLYFKSLQKLPTSLSYAQKLKKLVLGDITIENTRETPFDLIRIDNLSPILKKMHSLEALTLFKLNVPDINEILAHLPNLKTLKLIGLGLDSIPNNIKTLKKLEELDLASNHIQHIPKWLKTLPNLEIIDFE